MKVQKYNNRLNESQKTKLLVMIAKGLTRPQISEAFVTDYGIELSEDSISYHKRENLDTIDDIKKTMIEAEVTDAVKLRKKVLRAMDRQLDKVIDDQNEIDILDQEYRDGLIKDDEYRRRKTGLLKLNISALSRISKELHSQDAAPAAASDTPALQGPQDPRALDALMAAIQRGDTVAMQQLVITPNANN